MLILHESSGPRSVSDSCINTFCIVSVCVCVCVCVRACVRACVCVCMYALRIVSTEKILRVLNPLMIYYYLCTDMSLMSGYLSTDVFSTTGHFSWTCHRRQLRSPLYGHDTYVRLPFFRQRRNILQVPLPFYNAAKRRKFRLS